MPTQLNHARLTFLIGSLLSVTSWGKAEQVLMDSPPQPSGGSGVVGPAQEPQWVEIETSPSAQPLPPMMQSDPVVPQTGGPETPQPLTPAVGTSFNGVINNPQTIKPPDTHLAVGTGATTAGRVVEVTNADVQIFDKTGGTVAGPTTLNTFFGATVPPDPRVFDPKVLFDQHSGRFFIVALQGNNTTLSKIHIAVSSNATPGNLTTNWTKLSGSAVTTLGGVGTWADYPGIGADNDSLFVTTNQFDNSKVFKGAKIRVFDKAALIGGAYTFVDINVDAAITATSGTIQPAHVYGTTDSGGFYLISRFSAGFYQMFHVTGDPAAPVATNNTFAWTGGAQPTDTGADQCTVGNPDIDTLDPRMMAAVYRNAHVWCCYTADPDNDGQTEATWQDIATNNNAPTVNQSGFINGTGTNPWTYQPSININSLCTVAICYTQSSSTQCPSMNYATRLATDAPGTFQAPVQAKTSAGFYDANGTEDPERWGDYSATVVDPTDDCFWIAHEFGNTSGAGTSTWGTFIAQFCEPNGSCPPPTQACCLAGGCSDLDPTICTLNGGTPQGPGTTCATTQCGEACCFPSGACAMLPAPTCTFNGGMPQGAGTNCATVQCLPQIVKFTQPPTAGGEDVPSDIDLSDMNPNVVVADDFQSDGRPITFVRWWGSYLDQRYAPQQYGGVGVPPFNIDGWLVSFHEPLNTAPNPPAPPLGLYFCETQYIAITPENIPQCDGHQVFEYYVQFSNCCLLHAQPDSRSGFTPAEPGEFDEEYCFRYDLDIQAVVGKEYATMAGGLCSPPIPTPNFANNDFWGWHSTTIENGIRRALQSLITMAPPNQWLYGPWNLVQLFCGPPPANMSFELITSDPIQPPPCPPEACCMPNGTCIMDLPQQCVQNGGTPQGFGSNCATVQCAQPTYPKFVQPPTPDREDIASNLDWNDQLPNVVLADDFQSDGRPITTVRWWGSYIDPRYAPVQYGGVGQPPFQIDGWLISFHEPLTVGAAGPALPLGLYFCPVEDVQIIQSGIIPCDGHQVFEYIVPINRCCLICQGVDSRSGLIPAQCDAFHEEHCFMYDIDIQAVVGRKFTKPVGTPCNQCNEFPTPNFADADFWGWHSTDIENGFRNALRSFNSPNPLPCPWLYGPWQDAPTVCPFPHRINMAFELLTNDPVIPPPCPQACCLPSGACVDTLPGNCTASGGTPQGVGTICATTTCPQPPTVIQWRSVRTHTGLGPLPIVLNPTATGNGVGGPTVETRNGGIQLIEVDFDQPVVLVNPGAVTVVGRTTTYPGGIATMGGPVGYPPLSVFMVDADTMAITFSAAPAAGFLPNETCYNFEVVGSVTNAVGQGLVGDTDCNARALIGDVTMNGIVTLADELATKAKASPPQPVLPGNIQYDVNLSGTLTIADVLLVKSHVINPPKQALCP